MDIKGPSDTLLAALAQMRTAREGVPAVADRAQPRPPAPTVSERPVSERPVAERLPVAERPTNVHAPGDIRRATPLGSLIDLRV